MPIHTFDEWTETFGSERLTGALPDRLTHHVNILEMNGDSYRLAQSRGRKGITINQGQDRLALAGQSAQAPASFERAQAPGRPPHSWCQIQAPSSGQHLLRHMAGFCSAVDSRGTVGSRPLSTRLSRSACTVAVFRGEQQ